MGIYMERQILQSTNDGGFGNAWCSTKTDQFGNHVNGNFGDCGSSCCKTVSGSKPGQYCVFPFKFQGVSYNGCTTNGGSQPWCSTNTDALGSHMYGYWGNCDTNTCPL